MKEFLLRLFDFSQINWRNLAGFVFFVAVLFTGDAGSSYIEPIIEPFCGTPDRCAALSAAIVKYSKMIVAAIGLWKLYSPNWTPFGAPKKP